MTVTVAPNGIIELSGHCVVEDAEVLLQCLLGAANATVDWSQCEVAHTAVIQVLLVAKVKLIGTPESMFLRQLVEPLLRRVV